MSNDPSYCNSPTNENSGDVEYAEGSFDETENFVEVGKYGEELLIELYKDRPCLYDQKDPNFKDISVKQSAWDEISKIMIESQCGDQYTPDYCQKRCVSLREQYNREKKRIENRSKNRSAAPNSNSRLFPFYSQLTFLDKVIKRRRTYNYATKLESDATLVEKDLSETKTYELDVPSCSSSNKENQSTKYQETDEAENSYGEVDSSKLKRKMKIKKFEQTVLSDKIVKSTDTSQLFAADDAFMEFVRIQFHSVPEHEKNIRMKMIIDAISAPLPKM